jgi:hypothetical protein
MPDLSGHNLVAATLIGLIKFLRLRFRNLFYVPKMITQPIAMSFTRLGRILFIVASLYFWVIAPAIRIAFHLTVDQNVAESVYISLMIFRPISVFVDKYVPGDRIVAVCHYIGLASELLAFIISFFIAYRFLKTTKVSIRRICYLSMILITYILVALLRGSVFGPILPCLASLSGIVVADFWRRKYLKGFRSIR